MRVTVGDAKGQALTDKRKKVAEYFSKEDI
jgi:hypothetical protein